MRKGVCSVCAGAYVRILRRGNEKHNYSVGIDFLTLTKGHAILYAEEMI